MADLPPRRLPLAAQQSVSAQMVIVRAHAGFRVPQCDCLAHLNGWLGGHNGRIGTLDCAYGAVPTVFARRLDPDGHAPPMVLARFCPFCGEAYQLAESAEIGDAAGTTPS